MAQSEFAIESDYVARITRASFIEAAVDAYPNHRAGFFARAWDALHDRALTSEGGHDEIDEDPK